MDSAQNNLGQTDAEIVSSGSARAWKRLKSRRMTMICFGILAIYALITILGLCQLLPDFQTRVGKSYELPSLSFAKLLGTDIFGRSVLFKILRGTQTAVVIGVLTSLIGIPFGTLMGLIGGYFGGKVDAAVVWLYSVMASVPAILLVVGLSYALGKGLISICIAMAAVVWIGLCRLVRGDTLKHKNLEYVLAVKILGANDFRIIFRHILPNLMHLVIVSASLSMMSAIKFEVTLTFMGVGIQDGASWGTTILEAATELSNGVWWPVAGVTAAMFILLYALNIVADALRDALDPKLIH